MLWEELDSLVPLLELLPALQFNKNKAYVRATMDIPTGRFILRLIFELLNGSHLLSFPRYNEQYIQLRLLYLLFPIVAP
jgi:hypothetical protein